MTTDADETLIRQLLFRHRANVKGGTPNTPAEVEAIRFAINERNRILEEQAANRPQAGTGGSRRDHRPTSDGMPRDDER